MKHFILINLLCAFLLGCSGATKLPKPSTTTEDVLNDLSKSINQSPRIHGRAVDIDPDYREFTYHAREGLEANFAYLPNPVITLYVFQHLTPEGAPVPGYPTIFKMYEKDVLALPGELPSR